MRFTIEEDTDTYTRLMGPDSHEPPIALYVAVVDLRRRLGSPTHLAATWADDDSGALIEVVGLTKSHIFGAEYRGPRGWDFPNFRDGAAEISSWSRKRSEIFEVALTGVHGHPEQSGAHVTVVCQPTWEIRMRDRTVTLTTPKPKAYQELPASQQELMIADVSRVNDADESPSV